MNFELRISKDPMQSKEPLGGKLYEKEESVNNMGVMEEVNFAIAEPVESLFVVLETERP
jgi:hypothetical protein